MSSHRIEVAVEYLQRGLRRGERTGWWYRRRDILYADLRELDPAEAPLVARLGHEVDVRSRPPLDLRAVGDVLMRPVLDPHGEPCGRVELSRQLSLGARDDWRDGLAPAPDKVDGKHVSEYEAGVERWRDDECTRDVRIALAQETISGFALIDGTVFRPTDVPLLTLSSTRRHLDTGWAFESFSSRLPPEEWGVNTIPARDAPSPDLLFPLHHEEAAIRLALDPRYAGIREIVASHRVVEMVNPRFFEKLSDEERLLADEVVNTLRDIKLWSFVAAMPADLAAEWFALRDAARATQGRMERAEAVDLAERFHGFAERLRVATVNGGGDEVMAFPAAYSNCKEACELSVLWELRQLPMPSETDIDDEDAADLSQFSF